MTFNSPIQLTLHHIIIVHHSPSQGSSPSVNRQLSSESARPEGLSTLECRTVWWCCGCFQICHVWLLNKRFVLHANHNIQVMFTRTMSFFIWNNNSYPVMIEAEGLLQRLVLNNYGHLCANVPTKAPRPNPGKEPGKSLKRIRVRSISELRTARLYECTMPSFDHITWSARIVKC